MDRIAPSGAQQPQRSSFPAGPAVPVSEPLREAAAQFAGVLLASAFRPLAAPLGFFGDAIVTSVTQALARGEHGGLADRLARTLANATR